MKDFLNKVYAFVKANRRDLAGFLLSFLLAFTIWFIHNISLRYSEVLTSAVSVETALPGRRNVSANNCIVAARCRATGYRVLMNKMFGRTSPVTVRLEAGALRHKDGDLFYMVPETVPEFGNLVFGSSVSSVEYYLTDTLYFHFPKEDCKKVPVEAIASLDYEPQYMSVKGVELVPDSVYVYGDPSRIGNISKVLTKGIFLGGLSSDAHGTVEVEKISGVRISEESLEYSVTVRRYVTETVTMPVTVKNIPAGRAIAVYPSKVKVSLNCIFPLTTEPESLELLYVDYRDFEGSRSGKCVLQCEPLPEGILSLSADVSIVDCVAK